MCYKSGSTSKKSKRCTISRTPFVVVFNYSSSVVSAALLAIAGTAFFFMGTVNALLMCLNSVGILELAMKGNKLMAMAVCSTMVYIGTAAGTLLTTFLLKEGVIKNTLILAGKEFSKFQLLSAFFFLGLLLCFLLLPFVPAMAQKTQNNS